MREPRVAGPTDGRIEPVPRDGADALRWKRAAAAAAASPKATGTDEVFCAGGGKRRRAC